MSADCLSRTTVFETVPRRLLNNAAYSCFCRSSRVYAGPRAALLLLSRYTRMCLPETRQLARLGKKLSKAAQRHLQWILFYLFNGKNVAQTCRHFGINLLDRVPFRVKALQVDGGSEFAAEFGKTCRQKELPLFCCRLIHPNSTDASSVRTAPITRSSTRCMPSLIRSPC